MIRAPRRLVLLAALALVAPNAARAKVESSPDGIRFTYRNPNAQAVFLAGDFNGYNASAQAMEKSGDTFTATVKLGPGDHEYKFVVDGQWFADPDNPTTVGSYGNSAVRVGPKGEIVAMEATSNTSLNPKVILDGRYIGLFIGRRDETNQKRFSMQRPDFNIDLDFKVRVSEALDIHALTKIRNAAQNTPLWETGMRFDRGSLDLHRPSFSIRLFDNDGVGTWGDPLHLVGDIGPYHHDYGFDQQGLRALGTWRGFQGTLLYADNFAAAAPLSPKLDTLQVGDPGASYSFTLSDGNKNVMALRAERDFGPRLHAGASLRNDRGYNPGSLSRVVTTGDSTRVRENFPRTFEGWTGGGADLHVGTVGDAWEATGEILYGKATIRSGEGTRQTFRGAGSQFQLVDEQPVTNLHFPVDTSPRWILGGRLRPFADLTLRGSLEWERHDLSIAGGAGPSLRSRALVYRGGLETGLASRLHAPLRTGVDLEVYDFSYDSAAPWFTQLWFADFNFWMEHFQHRLPVDRFLQLGGGNASTWSPWLEWTVLAGPPVVFRWDGHFYGENPDQKPKLLESLFTVKYPVTRRVRLYSNTRWVRYHDPALGIDGGFVSSFEEVEYRFAESATVALSYGVDPFVLDVATNEYADIGRNEFLVARGATPDVARDRYLNLGSILPRAEQSLADERRVQVEAIVKF